MVWGECRFNIAYQITNNLYYDIENTRDVHSNCQWFLCTKGLSVFIGFVKIKMNVLGKILTKFMFVSKTKLNIFLFIVSFLLKNYKSDYPKRKINTRYRTEYYEIIHIITQQKKSISTRIFQKELLITSS